MFSDNEKLNRRSRETLAKPRRKTAEMLSKFIYANVLLVNVIMSILAENSNFESIAINGLIIPTFLIFVEQILKRLILLSEEVRHIKTRYNNSISTLLKEVFHFSSFSICFIILNASIYLIFNSSKITDIYTNNYQVLNLCISYFLLKSILDLNRGPPYDSIEIAKSNGLDYGSGMAHSYYHGYLKLVLPRTGGGDKNLHELMEDYESKHDINFDCYRLIILIPQSLYVPSSLESEGIEVAASLEEKLITIAGVQRRSYKNSVYKLIDGNRLKYVVAEYATPLKTFADVVSSTGVYTKYYKKYQNEITLQFYQTLKKILNESDECRNFVELIYYNGLKNNCYSFSDFRLFETFENIKVQ